MPYSDLSTLRAQTGGMDFIIKPIVEKFLDTAPQTLAEMQQQLANGDFESLGKNAHKLKSTTAHFGMDAAQEPLMQLERIWKENANHGKAEAAMASLAHIMQAVFVELKEAVA